MSEQRYFVKLIDNEKVFLNVYKKVHDSVHSFLSDKENGKHFQSSFTESEIKVIDERYWSFAVPVEEEA